MIVLSGVSEARSCWTKRKPGQVSDQKGTPPGPALMGPRGQPTWPSSLPWLGVSPGPPWLGAGTCGFCGQADRLCINHPILMDLEEFSPRPPQ